MDNIEFPNRYLQEFQRFTNLIQALEVRIKKLEGELMALKARMGKNTG